MQEPVSSTHGATGQALIFLDPETFALVHTSQRLHEVLGLSASRLGEMTLADLVSHPPPEELRELLRRARNGGEEEIALDARLRGSGGRIFPVEILLMRAGGGETPPLAAMLRFSDAPNEPGHAPRLEPGDATFVDFAARLGHDLNNLLSTVIGSLGLIQEEGLADSDHEGRQLADDALSASRECADLVDRLMTAAGKQLLRPQRIAVNSIIHRLVPLLEQTLPDNIDLQVSLDPGLPELNVDPDRLEAAILDLVVNAREAMPLGGPLSIATGVGKVSDSSRPAMAADRQFVQIRVSDAGSGIPHELRDRVLEPLFTTKSSGTGRGLGLSMVNGFVQQSLGALSVDSKPGRGTRVTLSFPPAD